MQGVVGLPAQRILYLWRRSSFIFPLWIVALREYLDSGEAKVFLFESSFFLVSKLKLTFFVCFGIVV